MFAKMSTNPRKWPNTPKQFVGNLPTNCLSAFDHFMKFAIKGLRMKMHMEGNRELCVMKFFEQKKKIL